ncbi:MAG TPA: hypothetical protein VMH28_20655 [Candidatus Acidoferrales bacterium]|nr:hypothetical protein [Candidatus Acidoferrales bacterium]
MAALPSSPILAPGAAQSSIPVTGLARAGAAASDSSSFNRTAYRARLDIDLRDVGVGGDVTVREVRVGDRPVAPIDVRVPLD